MGLVKTIVKIHFPKEGEEEKPDKCCISQAQVFEEEWLTDSWFPGRRRWAQLCPQVILLSMVSLGSLFLLEEDPIVDYSCKLSSWSPMFLCSPPPFRRKDSQEWISQYFSTTFNGSSTEENFVLENLTLPVGGKAYNKSMGSSIPSITHVFIC